MLNNSQFRDFKPLSTENPAATQAYETITGKVRSEYTSPAKRDALQGKKKMFGSGRKAPTSTLQPFRPRPLDWGSSSN